MTESVLTHCRRSSRSHTLMVSVARLLGYAMYHMPLKDSPVIQKFSALDTSITQVSSSVEARPCYTLRSISLCHWRFNQAIPILSRCGERLSSRSLFLPASMIISLLLGVILLFPDIGRWCRIGIIGIILWWLYSSRLRSLRWCATSIWACRLCRTRRRWCRHYEGKRVIQSRDTKWFFARLILDMR